MSQSNQALVALLSRFLEEQANLLRDQSRYLFQVSAGLGLGNDRELQLSAVQSGNYPPIRNLLRPISPPPNSMSSSIQVNSAPNPPVEEVDDGKIKKRKKKKRDRAVKDPNLPKQPLSSFFLFKQRYYDDVKNANKDKNGKEILAIICEMWKTADKEEYVQLAKEGKLDYVEALRKQGIESTSVKPKNKTAPEVHEDDVEGEEFLFNSSDSEEESDDDDEPDVSKSPVKLSQPVPSPHLPLPHRSDEAIVKGKATVELPVQSKFAKPGGSSISLTSPDEAITSTGKVFHVREVNVDAARQTVVAVQTKPIDADDLDKKKKRKHHTSGKDKEGSGGGSASEKEDEDTKKKRKQKTKIDDKNKGGSA